MRQWCVRVDANVNQQEMNAMKDREFLMWIHERLENIHGENACFDYMHKLRAIIKATPEDHLTPNIETGNSLDDLRDMMANAELRGAGTASDGLPG